MANLEDVLLAYSEWLDGQHLIAPPEVGIEGGDTRTHEDLAREFMAEREAS